MVATGWLTLPDFTEDNEDFVWRAHSVSAEQPRGCQNDKDDQNGDGYDI
jgi:hypothetical protein